MSKIYNEYLRLKNNDNTKLYLFKSGKFYIFIGEDCDLINEFVVLKKTNFCKETSKCGFPINSLKQYMRVFGNHKLNIEIIEEIKEINVEKNIINILSGIDIDNITPFDAIVILKRLKDMSNE